jgi:hypothetical protein
LEVGSEQSRMYNVHILCHVVAILEVGSEQNEDLHGHQLSGNHILYLVYIHTCIFGENSVIFLPICNYYTPFYLYLIKSETMSYQVRSVFIFEVNLFFLYSLTIFVISKMASLQQSFLASLLQLYGKKVY